MTTLQSPDGRLSFAKIAEPLRIEDLDLIAIQRDSFVWLRDVGLAEVFREISPIEDFTGQMALSFSEHRFEEPKHSQEDCKEKDMTYSAPLFVTAEFVNRTTGEIKSQTVFMGDFPMMTDGGTFIINGTERVVVSQLVRSPGVYFDSDVDKTTDRDVFGCKIIPSRGAWLEFEVDKRGNAGVRVDRKRRQHISVLYRALKGIVYDTESGEYRLADREVLDEPVADEEILAFFEDSPTIAQTLEKDAITHARRGADGHLSQAASRASLRLPSRPAACSSICSSTPSATTSPRSVATRSTRRSARSSSASACARQPRRSR